MSLPVPLGSPRVKNPRKAVSVDTKKALFAYRDEHPDLSQRQIASHFDMKEANVSKLLSTRSIWEERIKRAALSPKRERIRFPPLYVVNVALMLWFQEMQTSNPSFVMDEGVLLYKAQEFADREEIQPVGESVSLGWIQAWRKEHHIIFNSFQGESGSADSTAGEQWISTTYQEICAKYMPDEIWNCDETGLYWRRLPNFALTQKGKKLRGIKLSKDRITVLLCCSLTGQKRIPFVIGTSRSPKGFSKLVRLPVQWRFNASAWMTAKLFEEFLESFNSYAKNQGKKFALIMDNCSCHIVDTTRFQNVELFFLPPNCTSTHQLLDQGIIQNFKVLYRCLLLQCRLEQLKQGKMTFRLQMDQAVFFVSRAWTAVTEITITHCFRHAHFTHNALVAALPPSSSSPQSSGLTV
jgi:hypothetical protein